jgi:hypothetical protein
MGVLALPNVEVLARYEDALTRARDVSGDAGG